MRKRKVSWWGGEKGSEEKKSFLVGGGGGGEGECGKEKFPGGGGGISVGSRFACGSPRRFYNQKIEL